ncbi:sigma 54-interacting transcriptional regulator [Desulfogranum japonicum]|uniref:sigma 54-interacting transcriptional regulator n=1 Tax=Desulfogranum japonicum TaxID=231447 RepID=UPI00041123CA|nr:sigma 54-interacting transcriptional regulator [Desulfogranum japonicum]
MENNVYKEIVEHISSGILLVNRHGVVTLANRRALELFGSAFGSLVGTEIMLLFPVCGEEIVNSLHLERSAFGLLETKVAGGLLVHVSPVNVGNGETGKSIIQIEQSGRVEHAAKKLRSIQNMYSQMQAIFDNASDGIWVCDAAGKILAINKESEKLNNIRAKDFIGKHVSIIRKDHIVDINITPEVIRTRKQTSMMQYVRSTGRYIIATGNPVFDDQGNMVLVVVNERDVTRINRLQKELEESRREAEKAKKALASQYLTELEQQNIVAENKEMRQIFKVALKLSKIDASSILILGESGTGKGVMSRFIHNNSTRAGKPYIHINCAALPESLLEAELFGYEQGAFTGAKEQGKAGLFELAHQGTLFLDEIGEMPLMLQAKLLTYLDTFEIMRLGGTATRKIDCQLIAATNLDLMKQVADRLFRQDLFHRLSTFTIKIPPLRERPEDIFELTTLFLTEYNQKYNTDKVVRKTGMQLLQEYTYPGNTRELQNILKEAVVLCEQGEIDQYLASKLASTVRSQTTSLQVKPCEFPIDFSAEIERYERNMLEHCTQRCTTLREASLATGLSQATIFRKLKRYGLSLKFKKRGPHVL